MWGVGHGFRSTSYDTGGVASDDGLGAEDDGLQTRSTDFVDGGGNDGVGKGSAFCALPGGVLTKAVRGERELPRWREGGDWDGISW